LEEPLTLLAELKRQGPIRRPGLSHIAPEIGPLLFRDDSGQDEILRSSVTIVARKFAAGSVLFHLGLVPLRSPHVHLEPSVLILGLWIRCYALSYGRGVSPFLKKLSST